MNSNSSCSRCEKNCGAYSAVTLLILILVLFTFLGISRYQHNFTVRKWAENPEIRGKLVEDLIESRKLIGMTELEIISILGAEDAQQESFKLSDRHFPNQNTLVYYIGQDFVDTRWMILPLENGIVSEIYFDVT